MNLWLIFLLLFILHLAIVAVPGAAAGAVVGWLRNRLMAGLICGSIGGTIGGAIGYSLYQLYENTLPSTEHRDEWGSSRQIIDPPPRYVRYLAAIGGGLILAIFLSAAFARQSRAPAGKERHWCFMASGTSLAIASFAYVLYMCGGSMPPLFTPFLTSYGMFAAAYFFFAAIGVRKYPAFLTDADWKDSFTSMSLYSPVVKVILISVVTMWLAGLPGSVGLLMGSAGFGIIAARINPPAGS